jgi:hypothetical protein
METVSASHTLDVKPLDIKLPLPYTAGDSLEMKSLGLESQRRRAARWSH